MKSVIIEKDLYTRETAMPMFLEGGPRAVLLFHGYNGYVKDLEYIAERLNISGFTVSVPRLSGHGTSAADFLSTNADMWFRSAIDSYLDLKCRYSEVYICGLSMGGLLALILASLFDIRKIAVLAPALKNRAGNVKFAPFMRFILKKQKRNWTRAEDNEDDAYLAEEYWKWNYLSTAAEFLKIQKLCRKKLKFVKSDVLSIVSHADEAVPVDVADMIEKNVASRNCEKLVLKESPHVMTKGPDKELIADKIIEWLS